MDWKSLSRSQKIDLYTELTQEGLNQKQIAEMTGTIRENIRDFAQRHSLERANKGAPLGNKNAKTHGQSKNAIKRLTRILVVQSKRSLFICERCSRKGNEELPRHHKDRDRTNNTAENIEVLCNTCHAIDHANDRIRDENGRFA